MKISTVKGAAKFVGEFVLSGSVLLALPYLIRPTPIESLPLNSTPVKTKKIEPIRIPDRVNPPKKNIHIPNVQEFPGRRDPNRTIFL